MSDKLTKEIEAVRAKTKKLPINQKIRAKYPKNLYKELLGWRDKECKTNIEPKDTLYYWWWEFLRTAADHPDVKAEALHNDKNADDIVKTEKKFEDLGKNFEKWWKRVGYKIFAEDKIPLVEVLKPMPNDEEFLRKHGVIMVVPMMISRKLLIEHFKFVLDVYHPNTEFKRHAGSTAKAKLHPRIRDIEVDYGQLLKIWKAKRANDKLDTDKKKGEWEVYCDALGLNNLKKTLAGPKKSLERAKLAKELRNLYAQADDLMQNAVLGQFPKDDKYQASKGRKSAAERRAEKEARESL